MTKTNKAKRQHNMCCHHYTQPNTIITKCDTINLFLTVTDTTIYLDEKCGKTVISIKYSIMICN